MAPTFKQLKEMPLEELRELSLQKDKKNCATSVALRAQEELCERQREARGYMGGPRRMGGNDFDRRYLQRKNS